MSYNMIKKLVLICVGLLCSCSNGNKQNNDFLRLFYNHYDNYNDMMEHLAILNQNIEEKEQLIFDFQMEEYITNYIIAGVDYCFAMHVIDSIDAHDEYRCNYLYTREIYYELIKKDLIATVVFKDKKNFDLVGCYWTSESLGFQGTVLNYERNGRGDVFYLRKNDKDVLTLKFNIFNVDRNVVKSFQDKLMDSILET